MIGVSKEEIGTEIYEDDEFRELVTACDGDLRECPQCKSTRIDYDSNGIEPESIFVYRVHTCMDCETYWEERYDLVQVRIHRNKYNNNGKKNKTV